MTELASRYRENYARLLAAHQRLQHAVDTGTATAHDRKRLETVAELLTSRNGAEVDANGNVIAVERPRQFLSVDPEGQGRAVEVIGDLEQARNVAVLVPGLGNSLETFRGQSDRADRVVLTGSPGITKYVDEAADFVPAPTRLYVERAPGDYVSYSEWHGPDPAEFPDAIRMATNSDEAVSVHFSRSRPPSYRLNNR